MLLSRSPVAGLRGVGHQRTHALAPSLATRTPCSQALRRCRAVGPSLAVSGIGHGAGQGASIRAALFCCHSSGRPDAQSEASTSSRDAAYNHHLELREQQGGMQQHGSDATKKGGSLRVLLGKALGSVALLLVASASMLSAPAYAARPR